MLEAAAAWHADAAGLGIKDSRVQCGGVICRRSKACFKGAVEMRVKASRAASEAGLSCYDCRTKPAFAGYMWVLNFLAVDTERDAALWVSDPKPGASIPTPAFAGLTGRIGSRT